MRLEILQTSMNQEWGCELATVFMLCNIRIQHGYSYIKVHQVPRETISWSFSYTIYKIRSPNITMLYPNQFYNEVCYKGSVLYFYSVYTHVYIENTS